MVTQHGAKIYLDGSITENDESTVSKILEDHELKRIIGEVELRQGTQSHMSLGSFPYNQPPTGFCLKVDMDIDLEDLVTKTTEMKRNDNYELVLHLANFGNKTINIEIWAL